LAPDWHALGDEYFAGSSSSTVLIGDVDCTADEAKDLCDRFEVKGYPTLKYFTNGDISEGVKYEGPRSLDGLRDFVEETLAGGVCSVYADYSSGGENLCSDKETAYINKMKGKTVHECEAQIKRLEGMSGKSMKPELKQWMNQRLNILKQIANPIKEEL